MECNTKKAECIIHFSNYLMEQEDTTGTNTLSSDTLPAGFQPMSHLTGRQSCQASHTTSSTSPNPAGFDVETRPDSNLWALWYWECAARSSSCMPREVIPRLPWCFRRRGGLRSAGIPEDHEVSMSSHSRLHISEGWRQLPSCWATIQWLRMCLWKSLSHD